MEEKVFTRKELYDALWSEPAIALLKKYNISQPGLKKICKDMNIPLPENGYWQKIKFGKNVGVNPLSLDYSGKQEVTLIHKTEGDQNNLNLLSPRSILQKNIEDDQKISLDVPEKLTNPHKLIIAAKESLNRKDFYLDHGLISSQGELTIKVAPGNVGRALRFMDTLIKSLLARGHVIKIQNNETCIFIEDEKVKISLREKLKRTEVPGKYSWKEYKYDTTGILIFSIDISYHNIEWKDGKLPLEKQISKIIAGLELKAKHHKEEMLKAKEWQAKWESERRIKEELERQKQKEQSDFIKLLKESEEWHKVKLLRNYLDSIETTATENNSVSEELKNWLEWARKKADDYDPGLKKS